MFSRVQRSLFIWVYRRLAELDTEPARSPTLILLGETLTPEPFLKRLKGEEARMA